LIKTTHAHDINGSKRQNKSTLMKLTQIGDSVRRFTDWLSEDLKTSIDHWQETRKSFEQS
jgi:hypothetical protein